jgi:hypothetical protein
MHALIENGSVKQYPYTTSDLKRANPQTSFPSQISDESLLEYGIHRVFFATQPELTATQVLVEGTPVFSTEDQRWIQTFTVRDMTTDEVQQRDAGQAAQVRSERNALLAASDWTQLADSTADKAAWATYRQALRDITGQEGFPWTIEWPTKPE